MDFRTSRARHDAGVLRARFFEIVRSGPATLWWEPRYRTPLLYTSSPGSTSAPRRCDGLPRHPEQLLVEPLAYGVVVAVEDRLALLRTAARDHVTRRSLYLRQVHLGLPHRVQVLAQALPVREVPRRGDDLAPVPLLQVARELVQHRWRRRGDVGHAQTLDLPD